MHCTCAVFGKLRIVRIENCAHSWDVEREFLMVPNGWIVPGTWAEWANLLSGRFHGTWPNGKAFKIKTILQSFTGF